MKRSFSEAWRHLAFNTEGFVLLPVALFFAILILWLVVAVLNVPRIPVGAPPKRVLLISIQSAASTFGFATVLVAIGSYLNVEASRLEIERIVAIRMDRASEYFAWAQAGHTLLTMVAMCLGGVWLFLAMRGVRNSIRLPVSLPACETCGYDLTHQSEWGRCTECGETLAESTTREVARPDTDWERHPTPRTWLATTFRVLLRPHEFYRRLAMTRDDASSYVFAAIHILAFGIVSDAYYWARYSMMDERNWRGLPVSRLTDAIVSGAATAVGAAIGLRIAGLFLCRVAVVGGPRAAGTIMARIVDYQAVMLWPLGAAFLLGWLLTELNQRGGNLLEMSLLVAGVRGGLLSILSWTIGALPFLIAIVLILLRFRIAFRQTRNANF